MQIITNNIKYAIPKAKQRFKKENNELKTYI